jgi:hypothetical protein
MSASDGHVVGTTKVVDHGSDARRWTMVILAEGYRDVELPKFRDDVRAFVEQLYNTPPFTEMWCAINIYRVDVASTDSGADDPATCGDGTAGTGTTAATFFDATFCFNNTRRLLVGDQTLALATAQAQVPEVDATVVIVNDAQYGGAGGSVAWFSTAPNASLIGIHELGHSAFRLADEYADVNDTHAGGERVEPNITTITDRATTKWADLIQATTPLPTKTNPDASCATEDNTASPFAAGTIGLFEGGGRTRCGVYRPEHLCMMKRLDQPFCAVCRRAIRARLRPHLPAALAAPSRGVQFTGTLTASETRRWFTYDWPACWHVAWTVAPRSPVTPGPGVRWRVQVERATRERITYWLSITNLTSSPLEVEARYEILAKD